MSLDNRDIYFNTSNNYLKRYMVHTSSYSAYTTLHVNHDLGYLPAVRVFYKSNGYIFEAYGNSGMTGLPTASGYVAFEVGTSTVYLRCNPPSSGSVTAICIIYVDDLA